MLFNSKTFLLFCKLISFLHNKCTTKTEYLTLKNIKEHFQINFALQNKLANIMIFYF